MIKDDPTLIRIWSYLPTVALLRNILLVNEKWHDVLLNADQLWCDRCKRNGVEDDCKQERKIQKKHKKQRSKYMNMYIDLLKSRYTATKRIIALIHHHNHISEDKIPIPQVALDYNVELQQENLPQDFKTGFLMLQGTTIALSLQESNKLTFFPANNAMEQKIHHDQLHDSELSMMPFAKIGDSQDLLCIEFDGKGFIALCLSSDPTKDHRYLADSFSEFLSLALEFVQSQTQNVGVEEASPASGSSTHNAFISFFGGRSNIDSFVDWCLHATESTFGSQVDQPYGSQNFY
jgi:hypothetical protein